MLIPLIFGIVLIYDTLSEGGCKKNQRGCSAKEMLDQTSDQPPWVREVVAVIATR